MEFIKEYANWFYLIGAVLFILTLRGLSGPKTAIQGNRYGMVAMAIAVVTTFFVADGPVVWMIVGAMVLGAGVGIARARTVPMTQMPETVALMHSLVGLAAVLIAIAAILHNNQLTALFAQNESALTAAGVQHAHMGVLWVRLPLQHLSLLMVNWLRKNGQKPFLVVGLNLYKRSFSLQCWHAVFCSSPQVICKHSGQ